MSLIILLPDSFEVIGDGLYFRCKWIDVICVSSAALLDDEHLALGHWDYWGCCSSSCRSSFCVSRCWSWRCICWYSSIIMCLCRNSSINIYNNNLLLNSNKLFRNSHNKRLFSRNIVLHCILYHRTCHFILTNHQKLYYVEYFTCLNYHRDSVVPILVALN